MEYKKLLKYPHLKAEETEIWSRFIEKYPDAFESVDYDVLVGAGAEVGEGESEEMRKDIEYLTKKKIDVVGYKGDEISVIEIRKRAGLDIVGKVVSYRELYRDIAPTDRRLIGVLITDQKMPDVEELCQKFGIRYFLV
jgi:hypothetical protein